MPYFRPKIMAITTGFFTRSDHTIFYSIYRVFLMFLYCYIYL